MFLWLFFAFLKRLPLLALPEGVASISFPGTPFSILDRYNLAVALGTKFSLVSFRRNLTGMDLPSRNTLVPSSLMGFNTPLKI